MRGRSRQQVFVWRPSGRGGARPGAGRKARPENKGLQAHRARPTFVQRIPVHVTMRAVRGVAVMREERVAKAVIAELARASAKGFRVLHYSVQRDHLHVIAEGDDGVCFSRGMQRLASRVAMAINALLGRRGKMWRERYHRRDLGTPRQFRNALVYVTFNARKHARAGAERTAWARGLDTLSSVGWIDDWKVTELPRLKPKLDDFRARAGLRPVVDARTWIARVGWKRHGALGPFEMPRTPG